MGYCERQSRKRYAAHPKMCPEAYGHYRDQRPAGFRGYFGKRRHYTSCTIERKRETSPSCSNNKLIPKASNDVARKRIEEDLKKSAAQYADYAENNVSIKKYCSR